MMDVELSPVRTYNEHNTTATNYIKEKHIVAAIIGARAGSRRIKDKNKKILGSKPLICWTIDDAIRCDFIDYIVITTDDEDIIDICRERYTDKRIRLVNRPKELAQDDIRYHEYINHALRSLREINGIKLDMIDIILLQPTSPFRDDTDIFVAYNMYKAYRPLPLISVYYEVGNHDIRINGAIYISNAERIYYGQEFIHTGTILYTMPKERSVDIDTIMDWEYAESLIKKGVIKND